MSSFSFFRMLKKRKELIPIIGIMSFASIGGISAMIYALISKSDVIINKTGNPEPWENIDPTKSQKLLTFTQQWKPVEEVQIIKQLTK
ncbi:normal mucosa of esophagus-specific gene 1 protein [Protopterus annectens]|uniref:normal mucosa of esophagus-specific gene 1 protein n=1 Tax=Protopterus annectens TaxID=7888 RepID=UPI001CFAF3E2|nr:normal mucosa of esophagus-specific gene 1 protein [Protopterus annectens]